MTEDDDSAESDDSSEFAGFSDPEDSPEEAIESAWASFARLANYLSWFRLHV